MSKNEEAVILLVDDDESHAELAKINLKRSGLMNEIVHFTAGQKVVDFLLKNADAPRSGKYLVLLDINMPGLDGHQVLEQLKGNAHTRTVPVIMLTTAESDKEIEQCYALGCNLYMSKPMAYEDFSETIRDLGTFIKKTKVPSIPAAVM